VSLTEAFALTMPADQAMAGLLVILSEFGRGTVRERLRAGLTRARIKDIDLLPAKKWS
jgi:DNA invertase Pin-like site-specific DNA recombinase